MGYGFGVRGQSHDHRDGPRCCRQHHHLGGRHRERGERYNDADRDDTSSAGDHVVTVDTWEYDNLTFMRKFGGVASWEFVISLYGCGYTYPIGHWRPDVTLANGQWYRFEYHVDFTEATHVRVHPRVYDAAGTLIASDVNFRQSDFGEASWNGRSDWTLASYYTAGHSFCVNPAWMNELGLGNNGQQGAADTGRYWYFSGVQIRTDTWPRPIEPR